MEQTHQEREHENAERIERAKECATSAHMSSSSERAIAYALEGLLEIAIVRADVRSYEPPF